MRVVWLDGEALWLGGYDRLGAAAQEASAQIASAGVGGHRRRIGSGRVENESDGPTGRENSSESGAEKNESFLWASSRFGPNSRPTPKMQKGCPIFDHEG